MTCQRSRYIETFISKVVECYSAGAVVSMMLVHLRLHCIVVLFHGQARLASGGIIFSTCPFVNPFICLSVAKLVTTIF